jgi:DNA gyrase/topoisomerase IV subunit B
MVNVHSRAARRDQEAFMEGVISYRPRMGKRKLESLVKNKLHYRTLNQFIDHAVARALQEEFGSHPLAKKIADMVYQMVADQSELRLTKPTPEETREIEEIAQRALAGRSLVSGKDLLKRHSPKF